MNVKVTEGISPRSFRWVISKLRSKKSKLRVTKLLSACRRRGTCNESTDLVLRNLKLYLENKSILEENEKLRQKAGFLQQENTALSAEIRKKFPGLQ